MKVRDDRSKFWLDLIAAASLCLLLLWQLPAHAAAHQKTNCVTSGESSHPRRVDTTLINASPIARRHAGLAGHF
jgi:hypothetical protein